MSNQGPRNGERLSVHLNELFTTNLSYEDLYFAVHAPDVPYLAQASLFTKEVNGAQRTYAIPYFRFVPSGGGEQHTSIPQIRPDGMLEFYLRSYLSGAQTIRPGVSEYAHPVRTSASLNFAGGAPPINFHVIEYNDDSLWLMLTRDPLTDEQQRQIINQFLQPYQEVWLEFGHMVRAACDLRQGRETINALWQYEDMRGALERHLGQQFDNPDSCFEAVRRQVANYENTHIVVWCSYLRTLPLSVYRPFSVHWQGRDHRYYQETRNPTRFFSLPDSFSLSQGHDGEPNVSLLQFESSDGSIDNMAATFRFLGQPVVDRARIDDARQHLSSQTAQQVEMFPLQSSSAVSAQFTLYIPNAQGNASEPEIQRNANIVLHQSIRNELNLPLRAFQALWDAIFSTSPEQPIFTGFIDLSIEDGRSRERIDFEGRLPPDMQEEYWDAIIDQGIDATYSKTLGAQTFAAVFEAPPSNPSQQVLAIALDFGSVTASLGKDKLRDSVTVQRPVHDIIVGHGDPGIYNYELKVVRHTGSKCKPKTTSTEMIHVTKNDVDAATDDCTGMKASRRR